MRYKITWRVSLGGSARYESVVVRTRWGARRELWRVFNGILNEGIQLHHVESRKTFVDVGYGGTDSSPRKGWDYSTERTDP